MSALAGHAMTAPARVTVTAWGELRYEKNLPGALRVMVAGQAAAAPSAPARRGERAGTPPGMG
jgi:hypothetical protein